MEDFLKQLLAQIVTYLVFLALILFTFACLITGEFPPKKESVKIQYLALLELKNNVGPLMKMANEKLRPADPAANPNLTSLGGLNLEALQKQMMKPGPTAQEMNQILQDQARLKIQMDYIIQQNAEILKRLNKN